MACDSNTTVIHLSCVICMCPTILTSLCVLQVQTSIQQGKLQASDTEKAKTQFIVSNWSLNFSLVYCLYIEYVLRLMIGLKSCVAMATSTILPTKAFIFSFVNCQDQCCFHVKKLNLFDW